MSIATNIAAPPVLRVDLAANTGALRYGASGFLYGLGDNGVPTENTLAPISRKLRRKRRQTGCSTPTAMPSRWLKAISAPVGGRYKFTFRISTQAGPTIIWASTITWARWPLLCAVL